MADLKLRNLGKKFGARTIIENLNLDVESGKMISLLGPSGSGKTTTLRMIGGFIKPDDGVITIDNREVTRLTPDKRPTSMVFQQYALWPNMTVFQNISFGLKLRKLSRKEIRERVNQVLDLVDLQSLQQYYPAQLSGGQQQRVALARALVLTPKVLLLDEPLSNLDAQLRHRVRDEIREIQRRSAITTVFVTHDQDEALSVSDRIAVLSDGKIEQFDTPDRLYQRPQTTFVAKFIGSMNMFQGIARGGWIEYEGHRVARYQTTTAECSSALDLAVRPEDIIIAESESGSPQAAALRRIPRGHYAEIILSSKFGQIRAFVPNGQPISDSVSFYFRRVLVFDNGCLVENAVDSKAQHLASGGERII